MCFLPYLGIGCRGGGVSQGNYLHTACLCSFPSWAAQKLKFRKLFFDIMSPHNDHSSCVRHNLGSIYVFFHPIWVLGAREGVSPKGLVHNLLMQFSPWASKKSKFTKLVLLMSCPVTMSTQTM